MANPTFMSTIRQVPGWSCWDAHLSDIESEKEEDLELSDFLEFYPAVK